MNYYDRIVTIRVSNVLKGTLGLTRVELSGKLSDSQVDTILRREAENYAATSGEPIQLASLAKYTIIRTDYLSEWDFEADGFI